METGATPKDVAEWMVQQMSDGGLHQQDAAKGIQSKFGDDFVYKTDGDNLAIAKPVLRQFRKIMGKSVKYHGLLRWWTKE
jgi:hypothetical protein